MSTDRLQATARAMVADGKGLLAMDESSGTCDRRLAAIGLVPTLEVRRAWRELLVTAPGLGACISGAILFDETLGQASRDGTRFVQLLQDAGILVGIKVDTGAKPMAGHPDEMVTEGLDGLRERLRAYFAIGARFAKWRSVLRIGPIGSGLPTRRCIEANAQALARYAALCQEAGLVPVVEPEVLAEGEHTMARCAQTTQAVLLEVFAQLERQDVMLEGMILKPNMVTPGSGCAAVESLASVAQATVQCLLRSVPAAVPGVMFLSGGQPGPLATARLNAMQTAGSHPAAPERRSLPWPLSFSFARAIQHPALEIWAGLEINRVPAQAALLHRARCNRAAAHGDYDPTSEIA